MHSKLGETVELPCLMTGDPTPEIIWMQNTNEIPFDDEYSNRLQLLPNGALRIYALESNDIGIYECIGRNAMGETRTQPIRMMLESNHASHDYDSYNHDRYNQNINQVAPDQDGAPVFVQTPADREISLHDEAVLLDCVANGQPIPEIQWFFNNRPISQSTDYLRLQSNGSLVLFQPSLEMTGTYRCVARNRLGQIEAKADIQVKGK